MTHQPSIDFARFRQALPTKVADLPEVEGLIWAGSSADIARADQWSDHDFFLIVKSGTQERFRQELHWLPDSQDIAWSARETAHGLKVVYQNGFVLEFAVFDRTELSAAVLNHHAIAFGDSDIEQRVQAISGAVVKEEWSSLDDLLGIVYAQLLIGAGRYLRGERLVGSQFVRSYAVAGTLQCAGKALPSKQPGAVDRLDPWRRAEVVYPELAAEIDHAISLPVPKAALALAEVVAAHFEGKSAVPGIAIEVLRSRLAGHAT